MNAINYLIGPDIGALHEIPETVLDRSDGLYVDDVGHVEWSERGCRALRVVERRLIEYSVSQP